MCTGRVLAALSEHSLCWPAGLTPEASMTYSTKRHGSGPSEQEAETVCAQAERATLLCCTQAPAHWGKLGLCPMAGQGRLGLEPRDSLGRLLELPGAAVRVSVKQEFTITTKRQAHGGFRLCD